MEGVFDNLLKFWTELLKHGKKSEVENTTKASQYHLFPCQGFIDSVQVLFVLCTLYLTLT